ncbi:MAG: helix-turn-helix transcriptional regulator [Nocardioidaceae bacterium]|nr:helix-turn-helix transcriptional regulator [Nocardioidaceae bacterium]
MQAALALFSTAGYAATTIQAVADEAGVAVQTVYAVFGNKRELLRLALEAAVTGDAAPLPLTERSEFRAIADEPDARRRAAMDAAMTAQMSPRIAPILKVVREAAAVDPDFATTLAAITAQRRADMAAAATILATTARHSSWRMRSAPSTCSTAQTSSRPSRAGSAGRSSSTSAGSPRCSTEPSSLCRRGLNPTSSGRRSGRRRLAASPPVALAHGVVFEEYDLPGLRTVNGMADIEGAYHPTAASASAPPGSTTARAT